MPPLRRYIRISHHHTMMALIFLEDPADLNSWLCHPSKPALPRIVEALRDVVPAKLREELELERRTHRKNSKLKTSDTIIGDDFRVTIYLKDNPQRHSILLKHRVFGMKPKKLKSNSNRLGVGSDAGTDDDGGDVRILQEEEEDDAGGLRPNALSLHDIPLFSASQTGGGDDDGDEDGDKVENEEEVAGAVAEESASSATGSQGTRRSTRTTRAANKGRGAIDRDRMAIFIEDEEMEEVDEVEAENSDESFEESEVINVDEEDSRATTRRGKKSETRSKNQNNKQTEQSALVSSGKRRRETITIGDEEDNEDDDESTTGSRAGQPSQRQDEQLEMQMQLQDDLQPDDEEKKPSLKLLNINYEGFSIFGKALYMIVRRIPQAGSTSGATSRSNDAGGGAAIIAPRTGDDSERPPEGVLDEWMIMSQTIGEGNDE